MAGSPTRTGPNPKTSGDERTVLVDHPAAAGFVSLRAVAKDQDGNSVTQTMIKACEIVR